MTATGRRFAMMGIVAGFALAGTAAAVACDHGHKHKIDVDLDSLKAEILPGATEWTLHVRYKVEIEDAGPGDHFVLVLGLRERGKPLLEQDGRPVNIVLQLDNPAEVDDDEQTFLGDFDVTLPNAMVHCPDRLQLRGAVLGDGDDKPLDDKNTSVKFKAPRCVERNGSPGGAQVDVNTSSVHVNVGVQW